MTLAAPKADGVDGACSRHRCASAWCRRDDASRRLPRSLAWPITATTMAATETDPSCFRVPARRPRPASRPTTPPGPPSRSSATSVSRLQVKAELISVVDLNSAALGIGRHVRGIADPFNGHIDEFRISHVQRSDGWIATTWNDKMSDPGYVRKRRGRGTGRRRAAAACRRRCCRLPHG
jgi:hypothetical protein